MVEARTPGLSSSKPRTHIVSHSLEWPRTRINGEIRAAAIGVVGHRCRPRRRAEREGRDAVLARHGQCDVAQSALAPAPSACVRGARRGGVRHALVAGSEPARGLGRCRTFAAGSGLDFSWIRRADDGWRAPSPVEALIANSPATNSHTLSGLLNISFVYWYPFVPCSHTNSKILSSVSSSYGIAFRKLRVRDALTGSACGAAGSSAKSAVSSSERMSSSDVISDPLMPPSNSNFSACAPKTAERTPCFWKR
ncbi:unnamed protein product [Mycena citricolor]|uniref:Uncharacterized protein n=1 Tax=Mycena citricolor TaxID=2018698 RepID=A0AAD2K1F5_9AGAR|nr:unnamed protein product [Mycena citricolor]